MLNERTQGFSIFKNIIDFKLISFQIPHQFPQFGSNFLTWAFLPKSRDCNILIIAFEFLYLIQMPIHKYCLFKGIPDFYKAKI